MTARAPFQGETIEATIDQVLHTEPVSLRLLNPAVPRDLETLCLKCLEKEPARRYATAEEVVQELERFLRNEPILARPISPVERAWMIFHWNASPVPRESWTCAASAHRRRSRSNC